VECTASFPVHFCVVQSAVCGRARHSDLPCCSLLFFSVNFSVHLDSLAFVFVCGFFVCSNTIERHEYRVYSASHPAYVMSVVKFRALVNAKFSLVKSPDSTSPLSVTCVYEQAMGRF